MTRFGWLVAGIAVLGIIAVVAGWYFVSTYRTLPTPAPEATSTPQADLSSSSIYTNGSYGFSLVYPASDPIVETFAPWRSGAVATGTPLIMVTDQDGTVRIGASADAKELKACIKAGPAETALADMRLGSTTFQAFTRDEVGTENQARVTSYRAVHEDSCIAIESFQPLEGDTVAPSERLSQMIQSFTFARP